MDAKGYQEIRTAHTALVGVYQRTDDGTKRELRPAISLLHTMMAAYVEGEVG